MLRCIWQSGAGTTNRPSGDRVGNAKILEAMQNAVSSARRKNLKDHADKKKIHTYTCICICIRSSQQFALSLTQD